MHYEVVPRQQCVGSHNGEEHGRRWGGRVISSKLHLSCCCRPLPALFYGPSLTRVPNTEIIQRLIRKLYFPITARRLRFHRRWHQRLFYSLNLPLPLLPQFPPFHSHPGLRPSPCYPLLSKHCFRYCPSHLLFTSILLIAAVTNFKMWNLGHGVKIPRAAAVLLVELLAAL